MMIVAGATSVSSEVCVSAMTPVYLRRQPLKSPPRPLSHSLALGRERVRVRVRASSTATLLSASPCPTARLPGEGGGRRGASHEGRVRLFYPPHIPRPHRPERRPGF